MHTQLVLKNGGGSARCISAPDVWVDCIRVSFGCLISFGWIVCKWLFYLCGIAWKNMMGSGRGGACVPARVATQGRIHRSIPRTQCVCFFCMETPLRGRSGGHTGTAPTVSFGQIACECRMAFGQVARGMGDFVWWIACGWFCLFGKRYT